MILSGREILRHMGKEIVIDPFDERRLNLEGSELEKEYGTLFLLNAYVEYILALLICR